MYTSIALTGETHWRREPCRSPQGVRCTLTKLAHNTFPMTLHIFLSTTCQQTEKTWSLLGWKAGSSDPAVRKPTIQWHGHLKPHAIKLHASIPILNSFLTAASSVALRGSKRALVMLLPSAIAWLCLRCCGELHPVPWRHDQELQALLGPLANVSCGPHSPGYMLPSSCSRRSDCSAGIEWDQKKP